MTKEELVSRLKFLVREETIEPWLNTYNEVFGSTPLEYLYTGQDAPFNKMLGELEQSYFD